MSESITQKQEQLAQVPALTDQVVDQAMEVNTMNDHQAVRETSENRERDVTNDRQAPILSAAMSLVLKPNEGRGFTVPRQLTLKANQGEARFHIGKTQSLSERGPQTLYAGTSYTWRDGNCYVKNCGNRPITCYNS